MGVEIITHQDHRVGIGITVIKQVPALVRPVDRGALNGDVDRPPTRQGLGVQQPVGRPDNQMIHENVRCYGNAMENWQ